MTRKNLKSVRRLVGSIAFCLFGGFSQTLLAQYKVSAVLEPADNGVAFYLTNESDVSVAVLRWETPLEAELTQDVFSVVSDTDSKLANDDQAQTDPRARFTGRVFKRAHAKNADYLVMAPGETVRTEVDLTDYYRLAVDGMHTVQFTGSFVVEPISFAERAVSSQSHSHTKGVPVETEAVAVQLIAPPQRAYAVSGAFNSCSAAQQTELVGDLDASEQITLEALSALQNLPLTERAGSPRYSHWFGTYSAQRYDTVMQIYEKAAERMADGSVEFNCSCDERFFAFVYPIDPYKVYLCNLYWSATRFGTDSRAGTILHELSHFNEIGDTDDLAYGAGPAANLAVANPASAVNNADSIEYFAENTPQREISAGEVFVGQLDSGETSTRFLAQDGNDFFEVSGAGVVEVVSLSGDADLFVYSDESRSPATEICQSREYSTDSVLDSCEVPDGTSYITVNGYTDTDYSIVVRRTPQEEPEPELVDDSNNADDTLVEDGAGGDGEVVVVDNTTTDNNTDDTTVIDTGNDDGNTDNVVEPDSDTPIVTVEGGDTENNNPSDDETTDATVTVVDSTQDVSETGGGGSSGGGSATFGLLSVLAGFVFVRRKTGLIRAKYRAVR